MRLRIGSNIILGILGTFQMPTNFWTLDPLFIAEILKKIQENYQIILNRYVSYITRFVEIKKFEFVGKDGCRQSMTVNV